MWMEFGRGWQLHWRRGSVPTDDGRTVASCKGAALLDAWGVRGARPPFVGGRRKALAVDFTKQLCYRMVEHTQHNCSGP